MISLDLVIAIVGMSILFLRHVSVYKDLNKINYTPVVMAVGFIGAASHFILHADVATQTTVLKESLLSLGLGVVLSAIMSAMSQTLNALNVREMRNMILGISEETLNLQNSVETLSKRLDWVAQMESATHDQIRMVFKEEIDALTSIQANQKFFISKIEALLAQQTIAMEKFEEFTVTELPGLDNIVHRHIDLLRIAEQDHFNQLKSISRNSCDEQKEVHIQLKQVLDHIAVLAERQPDHTISIMQKELDRIVHDFARHLQTLGAKSESIITALLENDALLRGSREQSELIMQQMVLSSKQMREITSHSKELSDSLKPISKLFVSAEMLHQEFLNAKGKLSELVVTLESYERQDIRAVREMLQEVASEATAQIRLLSQSFEKYRFELHDPKNVQELAGRVKLQKSYLGENQE